MFCLVLINSLTIKSLFLASVIFRHDMFLLAIFFLFFEHGFEHCLERDFEHGFEHGFGHGFEHDFEHELKLKHQPYYDEPIH